MAERLKPADCPIALYVIPGPADDIELHQETASGIMHRIVQMAGVEEFIEYHGVISDAVARPDGSVAEVRLPWRVDATSNLPSGARVTRRSLIFLTPQDDEATATQHGAGSEQTHVVTYDGPLHPARFTPLVERWLHELLPPAHDADYIALRSAVERLLRELSVRVLENEQLLAQIDEREEVIRQLTAELENLHLELAGRREPNAERAKGFAQAIKSILATVVLAGGAVTGTAAAAHTVRDAFTIDPKPHLTRMAIDLPGGLGDNLRFVSGACEVVITQHDGSGDGDDRGATFGQYSFGAGNVEGGGELHAKGESR